MQTAFDKQQLPPPHILDISKTNHAVRLLVTGPAEVLEAQMKAIVGQSGFALSAQSWATVSVTCQGAYSTDLIRRFVDKLETAGIEIQQVITSPLGVTLLIAASKRAEAVQLLHSLVN